MSENKYELAGWLTIASLGLVVITTALGMVQSMLGVLTIVITPIYYTATLLLMGFSIFAVIWFRKLLNERYAFHEVDIIITLIIIGFIALNIISIYLRTLPMQEIDDHMNKREALTLILPGLIALFTLSIPMAIIGIVYGIRLLRLDDPLFGYLKPLAYTQIIGSALIMTLVLSPIGGLVLLASDVFQALILIQSGRKEPELEFV